MPVGVARSFRNAKRSCPSHHFCTSRHSMPTHLNAAVLEGYHARRRLTQNKTKAPQKNSLVCLQPWRALLKAPSWNFNEHRHKRLVPAFGSCTKHSYDTGMDFRMHLSMGLPRDIRQKTNLHCLSGRCGTC